jgi:glycosyltransferase involved in cell wall biosynthesis
MKVMIVTRDLRYGAGTHVRLLLSEFEKSSLIDKIMLVGPDSERIVSEPKVEFRGIRVWGNYFATKQVGYAFEVKKVVETILKKEKYDLIHVHFPILGKNFKVPFVSTFHFLNRLQARIIFGKTAKSEIVRGLHFLYSFFDLSTIRHSDVVFFVSKYACKEAEKTYPKYKEKFMYSPNFLDTTLFRPMSKDERIVLRQEYGLDPNIKYILFVGRLDPMKGILDLLKAFEYSKSRIEKEARVLVVGDGPLQRRVTEYKYAIYLGRKPYSEMARIYNLADILVLPSFYENCPMTLLEAMSSGLAVLASNVGDVRYILGDHGLMFQPGDIASISKGLERLINMSEEDMAKIGSINRRIVTDNYGIKNAKRIIELYESLVK